MLERGHVMACLPLGEAARGQVFGDGGGQRVPVLFVPGEAKDRLFVRGPVKAVSGSFAGNDSESAERNETPQSRSEGERQPP